MFRMFRYVFVLLCSMFRLIGCLSTTTTTTTTTNNNTDTDTDTDTNTNNNDNSNSNSNRMLNVINSNNNYTCHKCYNNK